MDKFLRALSFLLPPGWAFPRHPKSVVMRVLSSFAGMLNKHDQDVENTVRDWIPHLTQQRLNDWENALGLPDTCFVDQQDMTTRRTNMLARLRGDLDLPYDDSSGDCPGSIIRYMARYGYVVEAWYNTPFRVGRNRTGDRLGRLTGILHVRVLHVATPFRVSVGRVGNRLINWSRNTDEIICLLRRVAGARFDINVIYY